MNEDLLFYSLSGWQPIKGLLPFYGTGINPIYILKIGESKIFQDRNIEDIPYGQNFKSENHRGPVRQLTNKVIRLDWSEVPKPFVDFF